MFEAFAHLDNLCHHSNLRGLYSHSRVEETAVDVWMHICYSLSQFYVWILNTVLLFLILQVLTNTLLYV
jgi:hypothetical protein